MQLFTLNFLDFAQVFHPYALHCVLGLKEMSVNLMDNVLEVPVPFLTVYRVKMKPRKASL